MKLLYHQQFQMYSNHSNIFSLQSHKLHKHKLVFTFMCYPGYLDSSEFTMFKNERDLKTDMSYKSYLLGYGEISKQRNHNGKIHVLKSPLLRAAASTCSFGSVQPLQFNRRSLDKSMPSWFVVVLVPLTPCCYI